MSTNAGGDFYPGVRREPIFLTRGRLPGLISQQHFRDIADYSATCLDLIFVDECVGDLASSEGGAICAIQPRLLEPKSIAHNQLGNLLHYAVIFGGGKLIKRTVRIDGSFDCMFYPVDLDLSEVLFQV